MKSISKNLSELRELVKYANRAYQSGDYKKAIELALRAKQIATSCGDPESLVKACVVLSNVSRMTTSADKAFRHLRKAESQFAKGIPGELEAHVLRLQGLIHFHRADLSQAGLCTDRALLLSHSSKSASSESDALALLSTLQESRGEVGQAIGNLLTALDRAEEGDYVVRQITARIELARLETERENYDDALGHLDLSDRLAHKMQRIGSLMVNRRHRANILRDLGQLDEAESLYSLNLSETRQITLLPEVAQNLNDLGRLSLDRGSFDSAHEYFSQAMKVRLGQGYENEALVSRLGIVQALMGLRQWQRALSESTEILSAIGGALDSQLLMAETALRHTAVSLAELKEMELAERAFGLSCKLREALTPGQVLTSKRSQVRRYLVETLSTLLNDLNNLSPSVLLPGSVLIDQRTFRVMRENEPIQLSPLQWLLVKALLKRPGQWVHRDEILIEFGKKSTKFEFEYPARDALRQVVRALRKKLGYGAIQTDYKGQYRLMLR